MDPNFDLQTTSKKRKTLLFDSNFGIFCSKNFSVKSPACHPDLSKLDNLFVACKERQEDIGKQILQNSADISAGRVSILYHKSCRSSCCSPFHIKRHVKKSKACSIECSGVGNKELHVLDDDSSALPLTRSST